MAQQKIAAIVTIYHKYSHAQHIVDRFLEGYGWGGKHHYPPFSLVSLFVDQVRDGDLSGDRASRFDLTIYPTIAEALTLGTGKLAVDGVLLIGEHGSYGTNEKGQHLYPRAAFFEQIVDVFKDSGRSAPVFNDKHLSYDWEKAKWMYRTSQEMGFAFMAGSSLPVTWRLPALEFPLGVEIDEALCAGYGGVDSYDFHALETIQCMVERRKGGETGVKSLHALRGDAVWEAMRSEAWSPQLLQAALARSHTRKPANEKYTYNDPRTEPLETLVTDPVAYRIEYNDGLKATMLLLNGLIQDFNFAARLKSGEIVSTQMYLPMPPARTTLASFFSPLVNNIEKMFETGKPTYPVERTLLTTGQVAYGVESLYQGQMRLNTPDLDVHYQAPAESTFWRN